MTQFKPSESSYAGPLTTETSSWDFYAADEAQQAPPIPTIGGLPSQASLWEEKKARSSVPDSIPSLPVGKKDLYLVSESETSSQGDSPTAMPTRRGHVEPFYKRSWFWPVALVSVALGFVLSDDNEEK